MNKTDFIRDIAMRTGLSQKVSATVLEGVMGGIEEALAKGETVSIQGFGTFKAVTRASRQVKNPYTKEYMTVPERKFPKFTPCTALKKRVSDGK